VNAEAGLRVAVIGVGHLGRHHARILREIEGVELVAVVDAREERAREVAGPLGVLALTRAEDLPDDLDAVTVAVPTSAHVEAALPFLRRGIATLVEKPIAPSTAEADRLLAAARAGGALLSVGHVERYNPAIAAIRDLAIAPRFIEAHRLAPFSFRSTDVGVVLDLMIHDLDLILELVADEIASVDAVGVSVVTEREDLVSARIRFRGGCVANLTASRVSLAPMRRVRFFSPDSYASLDFGKGYSLVVKKGPNWEKARERLATVDPAAGVDALGLLEEGGVVVRETKVEEAEPLREELKAFVAAARGDGKAPASGEDGRRALAAAERILEELEVQRW
jgi:predicted dehydrogenase